MIVNAYSLPRIAFIRKTKKSNLGGCVSKPHSGLKTSLQKDGKKNTDSNWLMEREKSKEF